MTTSKYHYHFIGDGLGIEVETVEPMTHTEVVEALTFKVTGYTGFVGLMPELRGAPVFDGFAGPMYGGEKDGHTIIRYESYAAYERFSA